MLRARSLVPIVLAATGLVSGCSTDPRGPSRGRGTGPTSSALVSSTPLGTTPEGPLTAPTPETFPLACAERVPVDFKQGNWVTTVLVQEENVVSSDGIQPSVTLAGFRDRLGTCVPVVEGSNARYRLEDPSSGQVLSEGSTYLPGLLAGSRFEADARARIEVPRLALVERLTLLAADGTTVLGRFLLVAPPAR